MKPVAGRLAAALVLAVSGLAPLLIAPTPWLPDASAATCTSAGGVSVVVDFRELGAGTVTACAERGGGRSATQVFASVGVDISYATRQPGFVCRVEGVPASDPCVNASPANAYWGLWWSDGSTGSWTYSSAGVGALTVPAGGSVGWSWQQDRGASTVPPSLAPPVAPASSTPTPSPSPTPTATPTGNASGGKGGKGDQDGDGSGSPSPTPSPTPSSTPSPTPSDSPSAAPSPSATPSGRASEPAPGDPSRSPLGVESPGDSTVQGEPEPSTSAVESPGDSTAQTPVEAERPAGDEPARVPAAVTWAVVALLAVAIVASAAVARRRRRSDAP